MSASFQMLGLSGSRDERGLISMALPFNCATLDETLSVGRVFPFGLPETRRAVTSISSMRVARCAPSAVSWAEAPNAHWSSATPSSEARNGSVLQYDMWCIPSGLIVMGRNAASTLAGVVA